ncbi:MAG: hypothetical protein QNJ60_09185 [Xenococcaceae cyanobacterium MO_188.B19]|nr:hypothetical protein [Xenococcaceae cyanobacterium MO_188.B19]
MTFTSTLPKKLWLSCLWLLTISFIFLTIGFPAQALESENNSYFIKSIEKDKVLVVSPNFRGELTQTSLLPSLTEISENYYIKATKSIQAEKLNGKLVPGLVVYVESKTEDLKSNTMLANNY